MTQIVQAVIRYYRDTDTYCAIIGWSDGSHTSCAIDRKNSCYLMRPSSFDLGEHMQALMARAERDGVEIEKQIW